MLIVFVAFGAGSYYFVSRPTAKPCVISSFFKEGLFLPLDKSRLTNLGNLDPSLMNQLFDPDNVYSVPYMWGSTAIAVNGKNADAAGIVSFADLWKPEFKGKILLPNDMRGVLGMGLKRLGYSLNEADPAKVAETYKQLMDIASGYQIENLSGLRKQKLIFALLQYP